MWGKFTLNKPHLLQSFQLLHCSFTQICYEKSVLSSKKMLSLKLLSTLGLGIYYIASFKTSDYCF